MYFAHFFSQKKQNWKYSVLFAVYIANQVRNLRSISGSVSFKTKDLLSYAQEGIGLRLSEASSTGVLSESRKGRVHRSESAVDAGAST